MENQQAVEELIQMRRVAEEGRDAPLISGVMYVIWGGVIGSASLIVFFNDIKWISLGAAGSYAPWIVAVAAGWALSFTFGPRTAKKRGAETIGNRTSKAVWFAVGLFLTSFWLTLLVIHDNFTSIGVPPYFLFNLIFPIAFGLYGVAFFATSVAARIQWLRWIALLSWVASLTSLALLGSVYQVFVGALGSFFCAFVPGLLLMQQEKHSTR